MLGGKIRFSEGKKVEGSYKMNAWSDDWQNEYPIIFDGEITDEVVEAIRLAWNNTGKTKGGSSWGRLRWNSGEKFSHVDKERRMLITDDGVSLSD